MKVKEGNRVKHLNENYEGKIKTILPNNRLVVTCTDGFDYEVSFSDVVVIKEDNTHLYVADEEVLSKKTQAILKKTISPKTSKGVLSKYISKSEYTAGNILEIDLHLEQLVDHPEGLEDWQRLHTQMQHVKNCLKAAINKKVRKVVFIHGVGTGVLKTELHNYLHGFDNLTVSEADSREYGSGATLVTINNYNS